MKALRMVMTHKTLTTLATCVSLLLPAAFTSGCADAGEGQGVGTVQLALRDGVGGWLRLRIFPEDPGAALEGATSFDTACLDAQSRTYELTNIDAGEDQWVVIEAFDEQDCNAGSRVEIGYRGGVDIREGEVAPYYHVPLYEEGGVTTLPEGLNISASLAKSIEFCDPGNDSACPAAHAGHTCYDALKPQYWCVPACSTSADCQEFHPRAICQAATGWCVLNSPFPLNLSEPRAFGGAGTLSNGDAAFMGGFGRITAGRLLPGNQPVETFNQRTGLFELRKVDGLGSWGGAGMSGVAALGNDRFVLVGGYTEASINYTGSAANRELLLTNVTRTDELVVMDLQSNTGGVTVLPRPLAESAVVALSETSFLIIGGNSLGTDGNSDISNEVWQCSLPAGSVTAECQSAGTLAHPRASAAASCLNDECTRILVVGGRGDDTGVAEVLTVSGDSVTSQGLSVSGPLGGLKRASLCGTRLVGGSSANTVGSQNPVVLSVDGGTLTATAVGTTTLSVWPSVGPQQANGDCWVAGGVDGNGAASTDVFRITPEGKAPNPPALGRGRFGALTAWVSGGPIDGAILYGGGLKLTGTADSGSSDIVRGVEVLKP